MIRRPPRSTRTDTLFPYTTLFRSQVFKGKLTDVQRRATEGFLRGKAVLEGLDADRGRSMTLEFQNEFLVGPVDGRPVVMTPDRSAECRVGNACGSMCRSGWLPYH